LHKSFEQLNLIFEASCIKYCNAFKQKIMFVCIFCKGPTDRPAEVCPSNEFSCGDGSCINNEFLCDGQVDCYNGLDEDPETCDQPEPPTPTDTRKYMMCCFWVQFTHEIVLDA
jgi:hypothetical protein